MIPKDSCNLLKIGIILFVSVWCKIKEEYKYMLILAMQICFLIFAFEDVFYDYYSIWYNFFYNICLSITIYYSGQSKLSGSNVIFIKWFVHLRIFIIFFSIIFCLSRRLNSMAGWLRLLFKSFACSHFSVNFLCFSFLLLRIQLSSSSLFQFWWYFFEFFSNFND